MKPTTEQNDIFARAKQGQSLTVRAFAGSGKTTTLAGTSHHLHRATRGRGLYLGYNKAIVDEVKNGGKFPSSVTAKTGHALAYAALNVPRTFGPKFAPGKNYLDIEWLIAEAGKRSAMLQFGISPYKMRYYVSAVLRHFCNSADGTITPDHFPWDKVADTDLGIMDSLADFCVEAATACWERIIDPRDQETPISFDHYLKLWQLSNPGIGCDYLLFDEAQDANPVILDVVRKQHERGTQVFFVGDSYQQIYSWRGAVDSMDMVNLDADCPLTCSFRFGPVIASFANNLLRLFTSCNLSLKGGGADHGRIYTWLDFEEGRPVPNPDAILCRTNAGALDQFIDMLYAGRRPYIEGGTQEMRSLIEAADRMRHGRQVTHPSLIAYGDWDTLLEAVEAGVIENPEAKMVVSLMERHQPDALLRALEQASSPQKADLTISTVHKAKGREWDCVKLADDFFSLEKVVEHTEEVNLLYVAITRTRKTLDISHCDAASEVRARTLKPGAASA